MITKEKPIYTHEDKGGMKWRFEGNRPVSQLADSVMNFFNKNMGSKIADELSKPKKNKKNEYQKNLSR
jgi:hypothetical protein